MWRRAGPVASVATQASIAALTFDDGPDPDATPAVLDILARHRARATFFMVGRMAQRHPRTMAEVVRAGHAVGNHSWGHRALSSLPPRERRSEIRAGHQALAPHAARLLRPPYGAMNRRLSLDAWRLGHTVVAWSVDVGDWWNPDAAAMADGLARRVTAGSIVLLHDVLTVHDARGIGRPLTHRQHPDRRAMQAALDEFLRGAGRRFRFVTLPELLRGGPPIRRSW